MKKLFTFFLSCMAVGAFAQDTVKTTNSVGPFEEQLTVLKSDKHTRNGSYQLMAGKKLLASGSYSNGKKTGVWTYYGMDDQPFQKYNFTDSKMLMSSAERNASYQIESSAGDSVKRPALIGGFAAAKLGLAYTKISDELSAMGGRAAVDYIIEVDENGKPQSCVAKIKSADGVKVTNISLADIPEGEWVFLPAAINGEKTASVIVYHDMVAGQEATGNDENGIPKRRGGGGRRGGRP